MHWKTLLVGAVVSFGVVILVGRTPALRKIAGF
jgi:hypothetical protein